MAFFFFWGAAVTGGDGENEYAYIELTCPLKNALEEVHIVRMNSLQAPLDRVLRN
jgi:hypothetical protein